MTLVQKVLTLPKNMTIKEVAALLGTTPESARVAAKRAGITFRRGKTLSKAKITELEAEAIRRDFRPLKDIARDYGLSLSQCCRIRSGQHWNVANIATTHYEK